MDKGRLMRTYSFLSISLIASIAVVFNSCRSDSGAPDERPQVALPKIDSISNDTLVANVYDAEDSIARIRIASYSEKQLLSFLDSISNLDFDSLGLDAAFHIDSTFRSRPRSKRLLTDVEFSLLQQGASSGKIPIKLANSLFTNQIDSIAIIGDSVLVQFYQFRDQKFQEFAVVLGEPLSGWSNHVYFFRRNKLLSFHPNFHRSNFNLRHFQDLDGRTVFYYIENFGSGTGVWQHQYFFYKYFEDEISPVLNLIENSNFSWATGYRDLWFETKILRVQPLEVKFVYHTSVPDSAYSEFVRIIEDSVTVRFAFDGSTRQFKGRFPDKFSAQQMESYFLNSDQSYFIHTHAQMLRRIATTSDRRKRAVLFFLALIYDETINLKKRSSGM